MRSNLAATSRVKIRFCTAGRLESVCRIVHFELILLKNTSVYAGFKACLDNKMLCFHLNNTRKWVTNKQPAVSQYNKRQPLVTFIYKEVRGSFHKQRCCYFDTQLSKDMLLSWISVRASDLISSPR